MENTNENIIKNRSEILFLYDTKDNNPNGDPFTGQPRYDEDLQKAMVSDVRLKRYIRDYIDFNFSEETEIRELLKSKEEDKAKELIKKAKKLVFYSSKGGAEMVGERRSSLEDLFKLDSNFPDAKNKKEKNKKKDKQKIGNQLFNYLQEKCIDIRLFGSVLAEQGNVGKSVGTVQFKFMNRSINKVELITTQGTSVMKTGEGKGQGAIVTYTYIPYTLFSCIGYINPATAEENKTTYDDIEKMIIALWNEISSKNTRSKTGQSPRLLIKVDYKNAISKIPDLEYSIKLKNDSANDTSFRKFEDIKNNLDFSELERLINIYKEIIDKINIYFDEKLFSKSEILGGVSEARKEYFKIEENEIKKA